MSKTLIPPFLKAGDIVAVVAPAGKVNKTQLQDALMLLQSWNLEVVIGKNLYNSSGYFAGTDYERLHDLQQMCDSPEIRAVFCVRGGYGITRIIDDLDIEDLIDHPKWIIGFSDITALHLKLSLKGIQSIHGIMPALFDPVKANDSVEHLRAFLFGEINSIEFPYDKNNVLGAASGFLRGGNLSILSDSIGTTSALRGEDTILFIEEVDEYLYKIDRMLVHLSRAGILSKVKGLLIGHFTQVKDTKTPFGISLEAIILEKVRYLNIPVAFGLPSGHDHPNLAIPHNRFVKFEVNIDKTKIIL